MWKRFDPARPLAVVIAALISGLLAGVVASVLLSFTAEPVIDQAIRLEESHHTPNEAVELEIVSRSAQKGVGRSAAYTLGGAGYAVLFSITFLSLRRRSADGAPSSPVDTFRRALLAGSLMAGAFTILPFIKYPPNPPGVGNPSSLSERQWKYLTLIFVSILVLVFAARLSARLRARGWLDDERIITVVLAVVVPLGFVCAVLPPYTDAVTVPANMLWRFRIASLGGNLFLWTVLTVGFGAIAVRRERICQTPGTRAVQSAVKAP